MIFSTKGLVAAPALVLVPAARRIVVGRSSANEVHRKEKEEKTKTDPYRPGLYLIELE